MAGVVLSCGILVMNSQRELLVCHATGSSRWDIPKGIAEPGDSPAAAARRELFEETGLEALETELRPLGVFPYRRGKDLALFGWAPSELPAPATLVCTSHFSWNGRMLPEFDRFGLFTLNEALARVGKDLAQRLAGISLQSLSSASK